MSKQDKEKTVVNILQLSQQAKEWVTKIADLADVGQIVEVFKTYHQLSRDFDLNELLTNQNARVKRYKNCIYFGMLKDSKREGQGILCYLNGRVYEGEWHDDQKSGKAMELYENGGMYVGTFSEGKKSGKGHFKWANGEVFDGEWKGGTKHGSGLWKGPKGDSYIGEWKAGKADGFGVHTWINGDRYEGEFQVCLKHGLGTEKFANGDVYVGNYDRGKPEKYGEYNWANGSQYKGFFQNGLRHGRGIWKAQKEGGDEYEGEYCNDKKSGYGEYRWTSGNMYKGNFQNDLRHGYGEMFWTDGFSQKGYWVNGQERGSISEGNVREIGEQIRNQQPIQIGQIFQHKIPFENSTKDSLAATIDIKSGLAKTIEINNYNNNINNPNGRKILVQKSLNGIDSFLPQLKREQQRSPPKGNNIFPGRSLGGYTIETKPQSDFQTYNSGLIDISPKRKRFNSNSNSGRIYRNDVSTERLSSDTRRSLNGKSSKGVWRPSGVAHMFSPVGYDVKNNSKGNLKE